MASTHDRAFEALNILRRTKGRLIVPTISGEQIKSARKDLNLSQASFADKFGVEVRNIQNWEQGRTKPDSAANAYLWLICTNHKIVLDCLSQVPGVVVPDTSQKSTLARGFSEERNHKLSSV